MGDGAHHELRAVDVMTRPSHGKPLLSSRWLRVPGPLGGRFTGRCVCVTASCPPAGKGERGKPYPLAEDECDDSVYKENGFNIYVSNNIALDRSLPDIRHPLHKLYLEKLPNTSIIIPFHNEGWSSLLRTIHSIANRTPDRLVAEIILVDDFSDRALGSLPRGLLRNTVLPCYAWGGSARRSVSVNERQRSTDPRALDPLPAKPDLPELL
ncbi:Polypeptide N-acetylgalactosaminyltransferase-like 6-like [Scleropages formosus]|uniref:Polypeptide N-acetylgalactosaminyltransferase-like 6-like n=1 Tax=Scleropages formosus TaxID=113540 RepID=A0A0P7VLU6_SCLFO|nr:Polypeptide N-acetylgalactosaminyltransferase-like 6-like [Scleropages formosus]